MSGGPPMVPSAWELLGRKRSTRHLEKHPERNRRVLVVSEDPEFIHLANAELGDQANVIGCTGPVQASCNLEIHGHCPLARHASVALIDTPSTGIFQHHWHVTPAGTYAEELQRAHPHCTVVLCGAPEGESGSTGEVVSASTARSALLIVGEILDRSTVTTARRENEYEDQ